jgi:hypothetical protein
MVALGLRAGDISTEVRKGTFLTRLDIEMTALDRSAGYLYTALS